MDDPIVFINEDSTNTNTLPLPMPTITIPTTYVQRLPFQSPTPGVYTYTMITNAHPITQSPLLSPDTDLLPLRRQLDFEPISPPTLTPSYLEEPITPTITFDSPIDYTPVSPLFSPTSPANYQLYLANHPHPRTPSPIPVLPSVLDPSDARDVDNLVITNAYEVSSITNSDSSRTLNSFDSPKSGYSEEYIRGSVSGMDLEDPFIDDTDV
jgi:hypothetical protein